MSRGPMAGFAGLLRGELGRWLGRRGLAHLVVWTVVIQGQLYLGTSTSFPGYRSFWGFDLVVHVVWLFAIPGAIAVAQGALADERVWGTDGWVLARPVTRPAYVATKVVGTALPLVLLAVVLQGAIAYAWLPSAEPWRGFAPVTPDVARYVVVLGVLSLLLTLFVALCVALGALLRQRTAVAAIALVTWLLFLFPPGPRDATWHLWFPGGLVEGVNADEHYKRLSEYLFGASFDGVGAVWVAAGAVVTLIAFAVWRYTYEDL